MKKVIFLLANLISLAAIAQTSFSKHPTYNDSEGITSNICIGLVDLNGDMRDDVLFLDGGNLLYVAYQGVADGEISMEFIANVGGGEQWTISAGDLDNDGLNEILVSGFYDGLKVYKRADNKSPFELDLITISDFFAQGSNTADINNDGWLDSFICDDDAESEVYINDGTGSLVKSDMIDMRTVPVSDNSGNYGSTWIDIDNDRDLDLYIAKCRQFSNDPTDPVRINALFINDGNNNYTEQADAYGLKIGWQSWTADFGDVDNDGDLDCFIVNHDYNYQLLIQGEDGVFVESEDYVDQALTGFGLQGTFTDFDNDGFLDILFSGSGCKMLLNKGDGTFEIIDKPFGLSDANTYAVGDVNDDGFSDVFLNYGFGFSGSGNIDDEIYVNDTNDNNWVKFCLSGTQSNKSAIGTRIECHGPWGIQIREVKSGQSYGIMNSLNQIIGLGTEELIDSVLFYWPSGQIDTYYEVNAKHIYHITEGGCMNPQQSLSIEGSNVLCPGLTKTIVLDVEGEILWSDGTMGPELVVTLPGVYYAVITDVNGCKNYTNNIEFIQDPGVIGAQIVMTGDNNACYGETITLSVENANSIAWSNGSTDSLIEVTESGTYFADVDISCGVVRTDEIEVNFVDPNIDFKVENDTIAPLEKAILSAAGENVLWYADATTDVVLASGLSYETMPLSQTTAYYAQNLSGVLDQVYEVGESAEQMEGTYSGDQFNGITIFDVAESISLDSVTIETDIEAVRRIELRDESNVVIAEKDVLLVPGRQRVYLGFEVEPGTNLQLTTNENTNLSNLGYLSPRLVRNSMIVDYPYEISDVISIKNSNYGEAYYYYFYDWQVKKIGKVCASERQEVLAVVDESLDIIDVQDLGLKVYPIPTRDQLFIENIKEFYNISIFDLNGKMILSNDAITDTTIELTSLSNGVYTLHLENKAGVRAKMKFVKM